MTFRKRAGGPWGCATLGRLLVEVDDWLDEKRLVAVISDGFWMRRSRQPVVLVRTFTRNATRFRSWESHSRTSAAWNRAIH